MSKYLAQLGRTNAGLFNPKGRAFPDVAAIGQRVEIIDAGGSVLVAGTSCSSPIFASVISLLNDELISAGRSPLGFLNPFLYSEVGSAALNDIKSGEYKEIGILMILGADVSLSGMPSKGSNPGCDTNGFPALTGWDPVSVDRNFRVIAPCSCRM